MSPTSFIVFLALLSLSEAAINGPIKIDLLSRDSPTSPFHNPLDTHFDLLYAAFNRSFSRLTSFRRALNLDSSSKTIQSELVPGFGGFYMSVSVGTPPVSFLGAADTGSDLIWLQCKPCEQCYVQIDPIFDPNRSSSYKTVSCESDACKKMEGWGGTCDMKQDSCRYRYRYGDGKFTRGNVGLEKFTLSSSTFPRVIFGCGHENGGSYDEHGSGIIGLGGGPLSLVSQLGSSIDGKFSYCLSTFGTSKIIFGGNEINASSSTSGRLNMAVSTPLVKKDPSTYYYVTLEGISVGKKRLSYRSSWAGEGKGNVVVDSGTTFTFLDGEFYKELESVVAAAVEGTQVRDPGGFLSLCFEGSIEEMDFPDITIHFSGGADVKLLPLNAFSEVLDGVVCFTIVPTNDGAIIGMLTQMDFLVGYDLEHRNLSFEPKDCDSL